MGVKFKATSNILFRVCTLIIVQALILLMISNYPVQKPKEEDKKKTIESAKQTPKPALRPGTRKALSQVFPFYFEKY